MTEKYTQVKIKPSTLKLLNKYREYSRQTWDELVQKVLKLLADK